VGRNVIDYTWTGISGTLPQTKTTGLSSQETYYAYNNLNTYHLSNIHCQLYIAQMSIPIYKTTVNHDVSS